MIYRKVCFFEKLSYVFEMFRILFFMGERMSRGFLGFVRKMEVFFYMFRVYFFGVGLGFYYGDFVYRSSREVVEEL